MDTPVEFEFKSVLVFRTDTHEPVVGWNGRVLPGALGLKTSEIKDAAELLEREMRMAGYGTT